MKKLKLFPKIFLSTFCSLSFLIIVMHLLVYFTFPQSYLENRKESLNVQADEIVENLSRKSIEFIEEALEFYSKSNDVKIIIKGESKVNQLELGDDIIFDYTSRNNSLLIEEREIKTDLGEKTTIQFISTADMKKEAKNLSLKFLPFTILISFIFSIIISYIYAKVISQQIKEIKEITNRMVKLDRSAYLKINSTNEIGEFKNQINFLYSTMLDLIDNLEIKNNEIVKLERLKYDFFRGASHELKTPLASLKIILENMKYNIGKYKNRDKYIETCLGLVDDLTRNTSQILSIASLESFKNDEETIVINEVLEPVVNKYQLLAEEKKITVNNKLGEETIFIGGSALKLVLSNLISNAVKYTDNNGVINIGQSNGFLYIENTYEKKEEIDTDRLFNITFDLNKDYSNGLGLYIVANILSNYKIEYALNTNDIGFIFLIKIDS